MKKGLCITLIILLVLNLCATAALGFYVCKLYKADDNPIQYVMYVGTNDKDMYTQLIPTDEAKEIVNDICLKYLDGYTIQDATGMWKDEKGLPTQETTIVCYFDDTTLNKVHQIANEILVALNQNTVLIEEDHIKTEYYGG